MSWIYSSVIYGILRINNLWLLLRNAWKIIFALKNVILKFLLLSSSWVLMFLTSSFSKCRISNHGVILQNTFLQLYCQYRIIKTAFLTILCFTNHATRAKMLCQLSFCIVFCIFIPVLQERVRWLKAKCEFLCLSSRDHFSHLGSIKLTKVVDLGASVDAWDQACSVIAHWCNSNFPWK